MDPGLKILTSAESKKCDALTMHQEGMHPHDLMDRATLRIFQRLLTFLSDNKPIIILCGPGDNGADGLCLASLLVSRGYIVESKICLFGKTPSASLSFRIALYEHQKTVNIQIVQEINEVVIPENTVIIDALFGTGLTRPLQHEWLTLIESINRSGGEIISIDMPSGLPDEPGNEYFPFVKTTKVLTLQSPKPSLLYPENKIVFDVLDCGILTESITTSRFYLNYPDTDIANQIQQLLPKRPKHSHKGTYGHTLLIGGNKGMHGAIAMAAKSCYEAGSGLTTVLSPESATPFLSVLPQIMHIPCSLNVQAITGLPLEKFNSIAVGPGLNNTSETCSLVAAVLKKFHFPLIMDADALNILAANPDMLKLLPQGSLLTPHPAEFKRLFGPTANGKEQEKLALLKSKEYGIYILAKNTYSFLACPDGKVFYNGTGDAKLARGGSGDTLTGIIAGLFAQNQNMRDAALAGMYYAGVGKSVI
jgi:hydroxyethylthiazole kinase-like uncharacterized protein yjeF